MRKQRKKPKPLSTRRLSYALFLGAGFICVFCFGGTVTYTLFFLCLLLPALSLLHLIMARRRVTLGPEPDRTAVEKNQRFHYVIHLRNTGGLLTLPALRLELPQPDRKRSPLVRSALALLPGQGVKLTLPLSYPYRGIYMLPQPRAHASDLLGLGWIKLSPPVSPPTVTVCPHVYVLNTCRLFLGHLPSLPRRSAVGDDEASTPSDSRLYQYGDPLNRIHWKLTAQKNEMISRQFETEEEPELLVLLDTSAPIPVKTSAPEVADRLVECALAVLYYCLQLNCPVRLIHGLPDGGVFEAKQRDRASFDVLFYHLAALSFEAAAPVLPVLARYAASHAYAGVATFTSVLSEESVAAVSALHGPDCPAAVIYTAPDDKQPSFEKQPCFDLLFVPPGADIAAVLSAE